MTALSTIEREKLTFQFIREQGSYKNCLKIDLKNTVSAVDDWVETNQASYLSALPTAFKNNSTPTQKIMLLSYVLWMKIGKLSTE